MQGGGRGTHNTCSCNPFIGCLNQATMVTSRVRNYQLGCMAHPEVLQVYGMRAINDGRWCKILSIKPRP